MYNSYSNILAHIKNDSLLLFYAVLQLKYTYIHSNIHTYIHTHIHAYTHTYIHTYIHTYSYICVYVCMYVCIHLNTCKCKYKHIYMNDTL